MDAEQETLVKKISLHLYKTYCPMGDSGGFTREDLYHYGIIGLLKAKKNYNNKKGVPFNAYASIRIKGEIMDALRKSPLIRLPQEKRKQIKLLEEAGKALADKGGSTDPDTLAKELGWEINQVYKTQQLSNNVIWLDDDRGQGMINRLSPPLQAPGQDRDSFEKVLNKDLAKIIQYCMEQITDDTERLIFMARQLEEMTLKAVSSRFGFSIETARQKHISAKELMKSCLEKYGWDLT